MKQILKISEFARLAGITRKNLIFYDEIGLLSPEQVADNGYRFYSYRQLETVSVISALREIGMSLKEIKLYLDERSPDALLELFTLQHKYVAQKIRKLQHIQRMIDMRLKITRQAGSINSSSLHLEECAKELLFVSEEVEAPTEEAAAKTMEDFYELCDKKHLTYGYPLGVIVSRENLLHGLYSFPARYFFRYPGEECGHPRMYKPSGLYLTGFENVGCHDAPADVYLRMLDYIKNSGLIITGNSYEDYLLDEIAVKEPGKCLIKVSIQVEKA